jgi:hypothetical protein
MGKGTGSRMEQHRMKTLAWIALVSLTSLAACSRAEWQEDPGRERLAQEQGKGQSGEPGLPDSQKFGDCKSQTLNVTVDTSKSKTGLQDLKTVLARYPQMRVTKASQSKRKSVFYLNPLNASKKACADEACAEGAGWSQIQDDIHSLNGVAVFCEGQASSPKSRKNIRH